MICELENWTLLHVQILLENKEKMHSEDLKMIPKNAEAQFYQLGFMPRDDFRSDLANSPPILST